MLKQSIDIINHVFKTDITLPDEQRLCRNGCRLVGWDFRDFTFGVARNPQFAFVVRTVSHASLCYAQDIFALKSNNVS